MARPADWTPLAEADPVPGDPEGIRREVEFRHGEWVDEVLMAVLDHEWAALSSTAR